MGWTVDRQFSGASLAQAFMWNWEPGFPMLRERPKKGSFP
jgi:hypothetical protein